VHRSKFYSNGRNTPFSSSTLGKPEVFPGRAVMTIVRGRVVMRDGKVLV